MDCCSFTVIKTFKNLIRPSLVVILIGFQAGCGILYELPHFMKAGRSPTDNPVIHQEPSFIVHSHEDISHPVYIFGQTENRKRPVLLLHELPGLSTKTLAYAEMLSNDFMVYVPLLFGEPKQNLPHKGMLAYFFSGEWDPINHDHPITRWLQNLLGYIQVQHKDKTIGIIGMCLTGSMPLSLLDNEAVQAVVLAQPTLPLPVFIPQVFAFQKEELTISEEDWRIMVNRKEDFKVFATRFETDQIAKREKHQWLKRKFGEIERELDKRIFIDAEICKKEYQKEEREDSSQSPDKVYLPEQVHSTLIGEWQNIPHHPSELKRQDVRKFLLNPQEFEFTPSNC